MSEDLDKHFWVKTPNKVDGFTDWRCKKCGEWVVYPEADPKPELYRKVIRMMADSSSTYMTCGEFVVAQVLKA